MALKGENLRLYIGDKCIGRAMSSTFHVATQTESSKTKDSVGSWDEVEPTNNSWDAQVEALVYLNTDTTGNNTQTLLDLQIEQTKLTVKFDETTPGTNQNRNAKGSAVQRTGYAYITDFNITAAVGQNATYTVQLQGTGPLTK